MCVLQKWEGKLLQLKKKKKKKVVLCSETIVGGNHAEFMEKRCKKVKSNICWKNKHTYS